MEYKNPQSARAAARLTRRRAAIKAAGGEAYAALLAKERTARKEYRVRNPGYWRSGARKGFPFKTFLCASARCRGRKKGLEATITPADIVWPSHCPVLGVLLDYPERSGQRKDRLDRDNWPSLDRWDQSKGYIPGNVFVISFRANTLKGCLSREEILQIAKYVMSRPRYGTNGSGGTLI